MRIVLKEVAYSTGIDMIVGNTEENSPAKVYSRKGETNHSYAYAVNKRIEVFSKTV